MRNYQLLPLREIREKIDKSDLTCEELCKYYLNRIHAYGNKNVLNCVCTINKNAIAEAKELDAAENANMPLKGAFVLVKDNIDVAGMPTTAGSVALKGHIAGKDALIIRMLKKRGAVILGKTNMTEFANFLTQGMPGGFSSLGRQVISAYDKKKPVSGSSSGSAVAMSAGLCTFSVGTDTSFSVVGCATENGVIGYKPPIGKISTEGIVPITHYFDSVGFFTTTMDDLRTIIKALFGTEIVMKETITLAVNDFGIENVSDEQRNRYDKMFTILQKNSCRIIHTEIGNTPYLKEMMMRTFAKELKEYLDYSDETLTVEDILAKYSEAPQQYAPYGTDYLKSSIAYMKDENNESVIAEICRDIELKKTEVTAMLSDIDACLMTGPTCLMHYVGLPSISIPFMTAEEDGYPRSMILFGTDEERLLSVANIIEKFRENIVTTEYMRK